MTASPLDRVLALRPTNVVAQLGAQGRLPVLNPRDLLATLPPGAALLTVPAFTDEVTAAALRAAREADAVVGLCCPWPLADRDAPARVTQSLVREAEAVRHRLPLFLQAGPLRLSSDDPREVDRLTSAAWDFVEAGFTLISLDASSLDVRGALAVAEVARAVVERELSLELVPPLHDGRFDAERAGLFFEALARGDVLPQWVRLPASAYTLAAHAREPYELDLSVLQEAQAVAAAHGASLSVAQDGPSPERLAQTLMDAGVRMLEAPDLFAHAVTANWPKDAKEAAEREGPASVRRLFGDVSLSEEERLKVEARAYLAAQDLLDAYGARASASRSVRALSEGHRY